MALTIMTALELVGLDALMARTTGSPEVIIGLIDGPVAVHHPDLESKHIRAVGGEKEAFCIEQSGAACRHGTFVAGMLLGQRTSAAAAICPGCRLLVRPIFA